MKGQLRQMTKADKLRRASKVAWVISTVLSALWIYSILSLTITNTVVAVALTAAVSFGFQYVISLVESALFDGSLPAPWALEWSWEGSLPWLWGGAIVCLLVDVVLNLGGVSLFTSKIGSTNIAQDQLQMTDGFVEVIARFSTFVIATLFAVAPELLDEFAVYAETGNSRSSGMRAGRQKQAIRESQELAALLKQGERSDQQQRRDAPARDQGRPERGNERPTGQNRREPFNGNGHKNPEADELTIER